MDPMRTDRITREQYETGTNEAKVSLFLTSLRFCFLFLFSNVHITTEKLQSGEKGRVEGCVRERSVSV